MDQVTSNKVRKNIVTILDKKNFSSVKLANDAGIHYDTLRKFLRADSDMTMTKIERLADALDMTVVGLINWRGK